MSGEKMRRGLTVASLLLPLALQASSLRYSGQTIATDTDDEQCN
jgi:hypothetical protein